MRLVNRQGPHGATAPAIIGYHGEASSISKLYVWVRVADSRSQVFHLKRVYDVDGESVRSVRSERSVECPAMAGRCSSIKVHNYASFASDFMHIATNVRTHKHRPSWYSRAA